MDKNTVTGFVLIGLVIIAFSWLNRPSPEQLELRKKQQDSIAAIQATTQPLTALEPSHQTASQTPSPTNDSISIVNTYGAFASSVEGTEEFVTLENEVLKLTISNKGGRIVEAQLKNYRTYDSLPLYLFDKEEADYGFTLMTANNRVVQTNTLYFETAEQTSTSVTLRLKAENDAHMDFVYSLRPADYMVDFEVRSQGMNTVLSPGTTYLDFNWKERLRQQERGQKFEDRYAQLYYKYAAGDVEYLSESKEENKTLEGKVRWIAYKDQFFSSVFIAKEGFSGVSVDSKPLPSVPNYLKDYKTIASVDYTPSDNKPIGFELYLGPNHYPTLRKYDSNLESEAQLDLEKLVPLGWGIFRWVNTLFVIPLFTFFGKFISNYGVIILLLTLVVRIVISPLSYKSYMSSAKMRLMRPQIEELTKKYPGQEKAMDRQKATMELYSKAGVSPMSGCLPMVLQMPILFALFTFFPSSIELRQQSFLWAQDLSSYDAIVSWSTHIPFVSDYFGNHISLFCLLMTITSMIYTKYNMDATNTGQEQMPGMKLMMYAMPLMFLVFFNQYASGLSYYYFLASLFSILEKFAFSKVISDQQLLSKMKANAANSHNKKKSGFWARIEEAQRKQQEQLRKQQQKKR